MNPPYGSDLIGQFIDKLCESFARGSVTQAYVLVNNATETKWFQELGGHAFAVAFPLGRMKFWHTDTNKGSTPLQGQAVVYLGVHSDRFVDLFGTFGLAYVQVKAGAAV